MYLIQNGDRFKDKNVYFANYKCQCGNEIIARYYDVSYGKKKSCGCIKTNTKHGLYAHRLYHTWNTMHQRCTNPKHKSFEHYHGQGITICEKWNDVSKFIEDMYPSYQEGLSLDRIDGTKGYSKDNCRWATKETQSTNQKAIRSTNTSGYRGVSWNKANNKWDAKITVSNKKTYLGGYKTAEDAAIAYNDFVLSNNLDYPINEGVRQ